MQCNDLICPDVFPEHTLHLSALLLLYMHHSQEPTGESGKVCIFNTPPPPSSSVWQTLLLKLLPRVGVKTKFLPLLPTLISSNFCEPNQKVSFSAVISPTCRGWVLSLRFTLPICKTTSFWREVIWKPSDSEIIQQQRHQFAVTQQLIKSGRH